jgi:UDP-glucose 4-epimerase
VILSQAARILGRHCVPVIPPVGGSLATLALKRLGLLDWPPHLLRLIRYGRVVDISRLRDHFGWEPRRSSCEVLHDYADGRSGAPTELDAPPPSPNGVEPARPRLLESAKRG